MMTTTMRLPVITRSSAIAETARVTIRSVIEVGRLTVTINMTYVNHISLIELSMHGILYPVICCIKCRLDK